VAQKKSDRSPEQLRPLIEADHPQLSVRRQCQLLGLSRSTLYYEAAAETPENLRLIGAARPGVHGAPVPGEPAADHPLTAEFEEQMVKLVREYKGDGEFLSVHHPDKPNARDDAPDATALALMGAKGDSLGEIPFI